ncbi:MAG: RluA family pseudouridine synthase [Acidobacteria bacterium]|nr:RluA family pseudouridine synthase [Acidobacteriota bacterium]
MSDPAAPAVLTAVSGQRLDQFVSAELPQYSRSRIQEWIKAGRVLVDGVARKASHELRGGEQIAVQPAQLTPLHATPEEIPLTVLYEDAAVVVIDKPAGMVVHAGAGVSSGTLTNALLHRFETLSTAGGDERPGIVHRLDKETSGVIVIAKTDPAHQALAQQFASREVEKIYLAMVEGRMAAATGTITKPIARDPHHRTRMTTRVPTGSTALTQWTVRQQLAHHSFLEVKIGTGRTHQIRVHLASIKHPVVGDTLYGAKPAPVLGERFFLHAHRLTFTSPATGERVTVEAPLAPELAHFLETLLISV